MTISSNLRGRMALVSVSFVHNRYTNHAPLNFDIAFLVITSYSCEALFSSVRGLEVALRTFHIPNNKPRIEFSFVVHIYIILIVTTLFPSTSQHFQQQSKHQSYPEFHHS